LAGKVYNAKTLEPIRAKIYYYELKSNKEVGDALSNSSDGKYQIILPADNKYSFLSFKGGYYPISEKLEVGKIDKYKEIIIDLFLYPIEVGETIPLNNLFYEEKTETLLTESEAELNRLKIFMEKYPEMTIEIRGPTEIKTNNIKNYLTKKGVEEKRIIPKTPKNKTGGTFTIISLSKQDKNIERKGDFSKNIDPDKLKKGQIYRLNKTYFTADSTEISKNATRELEILKKFLIKNTTVTIEIGGHTNSLPDDGYCNELSEKRAKTVANYLKSGGISAKRIKYKGYGKRQPIATNETLRGRQRNQRVEIRILRVGQKSTDRTEQNTPSGSG
jgi:outer membrane protein OmpA-like peptidoglycan-associated protein